MLMDLDKTLARESIIENYEPSVEHTDFLTSDELEEIWKSAFQQASASTNKWNRTVFISRDLTHICKKYENRIDEILPRPRIQYGGNFFITSVGYGLHTDSYNQTEVKTGGRCIPWRNLLIPLWCDDDGGVIKFYRNRFPTWSVSGTRGAKGDYTEFRDLEIENEFAWKPRSVFVFDSCQLHESPTHCGKFKLKMGLLIKFIREVV